MTWWLAESQSAPGLARIERAASPWKQVDFPGRRPQIKRRPRGRPLPSRGAVGQSSRMNVTFRCTRYSETLPFASTMTS